MFPLQASVTVPSARYWRRGSRRFDPSSPTLLRLCACQPTRRLIDRSYTWKLPFSALIFKFSLLGKGKRLKCDRFAAGRRAEVIARVTSHLSCLLLPAALFGPSTPHTSSNLHTTPFLPYH